MGTSITAVLYPPSFIAAVIRIQSGDKAALDEESYHFLVRRVGRFARRLHLDDRHLQEDVVQEVAIAITRTLGARFDPDRGTMGAYLFGLTQNAVRRVRALTATVPAPVWNTPLLASNGETAEDVASPSDDVVSRLTGRELAASIVADVDEVTADVLLRVFAHGESQQAVASITGWSRSKVDRAVSRAVARARTRFPDLIEFPNRGASRDHATAA